MRVLSLDTETYSELPLKKVGAYRYAEACETIIVTFAWDDEPVVAWDLTDGTRTVADVQQLVDAADRVVIHNSPFERRTLASQGVTIPVEKIDDTMVMALSHGLPGSLEQLCHALHVPADKEKDKAGKKLIHLFTKPRPKNVKLRRATRETHPDEWRAFIEYAKRDVDAMRDVYRRIPRWNCTQRERDYWLLDQASADSGFAIDLGLARSAIAAFDRASRALAAHTADLTEGALGSTTQRDALLNFLRTDCGLVLQDMTKDTVEWALTQEISPLARALLETRSQAASTTPSKYRALIEATGADGRLRGAVQFCGAARTGRDAGRIFQPQNLIRTPGWFDGTVQEIVIAAFKEEGAVELIWDNVIELCAFAVRGAVVAGEGRKFVISDLSNIEGRFAAWLADERWKLDAFRAYDAGTGPDLYKLAASKILGKLVEEVTKDDRQKIGKTSELACQFGGAVGAFRTMGGVAVDGMSDDEIVVIIKGWRAAHTRIKNYWYALENAARAALRSPGETLVCDQLAFDCKVDDFGVKWLRLRLPSGRYLCYMEPEGTPTKCGVCHGQGVVLTGGFVEDQATKPSASYEVCPECGGQGEWGGSELTYMGVDQYTRQWKRQKTYGGKIFENAVQAGARDVFFHGMQLAMQDFGWEPIYDNVQLADGTVGPAIVMWRGTNADGCVVLRVHDELVCEVPDADEYTVDRLSQLMATNPPWAAGLPLAAAGFEARRYRKGD